MAGHSKWANIKHRKEKADKTRGKIFSRISKEIITAVKLHGPDPKSNPRLRLVLQKAKDNNVPNDNVERNIKKGMSQDQANYEEITYELYGYGGVGILVEALTDNRNRLSSEMRIATNKRGGHAANPGAVSFNFERKGIIIIKKDSFPEDKVFEIALEAGASDFEASEEVFLITTEPHDLMSVKEEMQKKGFHIEEASLQMINKNEIECSEEDKTSNLALIEWIENIDDVDEIYHNMKED